MIGRPLSKSSVIGMTVLSLDIYKCKMWWAWHNRTNTRSALICAKDVGLKPYLNLNSSCFSPSIFHTKFIILLNIYITKEKDDN